MARKKNDPRESAPKNAGADDGARAGMNGGSSGNAGAGRSPGKKAAGRTASGEGGAKGGQQRIPLNEGEAREQRPERRSAKAPAPDGTRPQQQRGSSRRPATEETAPSAGKDTGAAEYQPSGRSPDQRTEVTDAAKAPAKRGRGKKVAGNDPQAVDPEQETPVPAKTRKTRARTKAAPATENAIPPAVLPEPVEAMPPSAAPVSPPAHRVRHGVSLLTDLDLHLFREGKHYRLYEKFGAHTMEHEGTLGTLFTLWAPNAERVSVMGDFNQWDRDGHVLKERDDGSGIWEGFVPEVIPGMLYKYHIRSRYHMYHAEKSDPFAFAREMPPQTASVVAEGRYDWNDHEWMRQRQERTALDRPYSVYEMHLGSWRRKPEDNDRPLTYHELAQELPRYLKEMNFTHVEFMPVMFHPFNGSWGYQITGYFANASQYGTPQDLMHLIDVLHQNGIGVILDWVPSHFPGDEHGLVYFDGTHLYEHADMRKGFHPDWNSYIFNYGRNEIRSFLISNAMFWLDKYHVDGLRVDAVASMLYLDYSRKEGEWIPNEHGGRENLEAISFLKELNEAVHEHHPGTVTIAEESTAWPGVTNLTEHGGLGFDMKWMMGWMHDSLSYFGRDPIHRKYHQGEITFSMIYAFSEKFMLPLSHDEVVHGKGSLLRRMPGDDWQRFANLRLLYSYMYGHPGKKLLFMGAEMAMYDEWGHDRSLDWHLLEYPSHAGIQHLIRDLNAIYMHEPSLHAKDLSAEGFEWIDHKDEHNSVISFIRKGRWDNEIILVVCNFTPVVHHHYRMGVPRAGHWSQIFTSDHRRYGGSGFEEERSLDTIDASMHGREHTLELKLPPLGVVYYKFMG